MEKGKYLKFLSSVTFPKTENIISLDKNDNIQLGDEIKRIKTACCACISNCSVIATVKKWTSYSY